MCMLDSPCIDPYIMVSLAVWWWVFSCTGFAGSPGALLGFDVLDKCEPPELLPTPAVLGASTVYHSTQSLHGETCWPAAADRRSHPTFSGICA